MRQDFKSLPKIAAGKLTDNKRMEKDAAFSKQRVQPDTSIPQMRHPNRIVN